MDVEQFSKYIFNADPRNAGEKYAQKIVSGMFDMPKAKLPHYDLDHPLGRCEVKSTRIVEEKTEQNDGLSLMERAINFSVYEQYRFCGNLQHLKLYEFDHLWYVAFFRDVVVIFGMTVEELRDNARSIGYSATQTRGSVPDCDGQFPLRNTNLQFHLRKFIKARLTYPEAFNNYQAAETITKISFNSK